MTDLSIIIVSWNVRDLLAACLDSIATAPLVLGQQVSAEGLLQAEVIVVDSASTDGSAAMIREQYPWVHLVAETENVGFTRGNNIALALAQGRHLMLLNPDTVVHGDALNRLARQLDEHPRVGIVGPRVLNDDGTTQSTRRRFLRPLTGFFESTWLQGYAPRRWLDHFYVADQPDDGIFDVDWVQGCALMARREVYAQIGPLDEGYVMFFEETDWCRRAKAHGWRVVYVGHACITHYGGQSTGQVEANKHIFFQRSKLRYYWKYHGRGLALVLRAFLLLSYAAQVILEGSKALLGYRRNMRMQRIRTYLRVIHALSKG